jgi:tetratricopeptide (TPR) repeat protein
VTPSEYKLEELKSNIQALIDEGRFEDAVVTLEELILMLEKPEMANREEMIEALEHLGACYFGMQQYDRTVSVYSRLVVNLDEKFGMDHIETIKAVYKLAKASEKSGNREQAQTLYYVAKDSAQKTLPDLHYLRQSINESYHSIVRPKRVVESVNAFVVGDLQDPKEIMKAARSLGPTLKRMSKRMDVFVSVLCTLVLIVGSGIWTTLEVSKKKDSAKQTQTVSASVPDNRAVADDSSFATSDQLLTLKCFNDSEGEVSCDGTAIKISIVTLTDSFDSVLKIYSRGIIGNRVWAEDFSQCMKLENGLQLFRAGSAELKLSAACSEIAQQLNEYYKKNDGYPDAKSPIVINARLAYINPLTGKSQAVTYQNFSQFMQLSHMFDGAQNQGDVVKFLKAGGKWIDEPPFIAGDIHCSSRYSGEKHGDNFIIPNAYLHVAGKERELLPGSIPGEVLVIFLEKGEKVDDPAQRSRLRELACRTFQDKTLYLVKSKGLFTNAWLLKNLTTVILATLFLFSIGWWFVFDARARLADRHGALRVSEIALASMGIIFVCWILLTVTIQ